MLPSTAQTTEIDYSQFYVPDLGRSVDLLAIPGSFERTVGPPERRKEPSYGCPVPACHCEYVTAAARAKHWREVHIPDQSGLTVTEFSKIRQALEKSGLPLPTSWLLFYDAPAAPKSLDTLAKIQSTVEEIRDTQIGVAAHVNTQLGAVTKTLDEVVQNQSHANRKLDEIFATQSEVIWKLQRIETTTTETQLEVQKLSRMALENETRMKELEGHFKETQHEKEMARGKYDFMLSTSEEIATNHAENKRGLAHVMRRASFSRSGLYRSHYSHLPSQKKMKLEPEDVVFEAKITVVRNDSQVRLASAWSSIIERYENVPQSDEVVDLMKIESADEQMKLKGAVHPDAVPSEDFVDLDDAESSDEDYDTSDSNTEDLEDNESDGGEEEPAEIGGRERSLI